MIKNKIKVGTGLLVLALLATTFAYGQRKASLKILAHPVSPPAKVWINGQQMMETPLDLPYFQAGTHTIRVIRKGASIERKVLIKQGVEVVLIADFIMNEIRVKNQEELNYKPVQGKNVLKFTSTRYEPAPPEKKSGPSFTIQPEKKAEPQKPVPAKPAETDVPDKPLKIDTTPSEVKPDATVEPTADAEGSSSKPSEVEPETAGVETADTQATGDVEESGPSSSREPLPCEPGEWCPEPGEGEMGPPVPPAVMESIRLIEQEEEARREALEEEARRAAEEAAREEAAREEAAQPPPVEIPAPRPTGPAPPCARKQGASACATYGTGIRDTVYKYYCLLANNDFAGAFELWSTTRSLVWFYNASGSFCAVHDYRIRGFQVASSTTDRADAVYVVDLIDANNRVMETWQMRTILVKSGGRWRIRTVSGKTIP